MLRERTDLVLSAFTTSDQEMERVHSYNPGARMGHNTRMIMSRQRIKWIMKLRVMISETDLKEIGRRYVRQM